MHLVILGPQASGKGTQASMLAQTLGLKHISVGERLRQEVAAGTPIGRQIRSILEKGDLVPDDLTNRIVARYVRENDEGFILDGYPRTEEQAHFLDGATYIHSIIHLDIFDSTAVERVSGRRECPKGHDYHLVHNPPKREGLCDIDGLPLTKRPDDTEDAIRHRLELYHQETEPLLRHYGTRVVTIDGEQSIAQVHRTIVSRLKQLG